MMTVRCTEGEPGDKLSPDSGRLTIALRPPSGMSAPNARSDWTRRILPELRRCAKASRREPGDRGVAPHFAWASYDRVAAGHRQPM